MNRGVAEAVSRGLEEQQFSPTGDDEGAPHSLPARHFFHIPPVDSIRRCTDDERLIVPDDNSLFSVEGQGKEGRRKGAWGYEGR